MNVASLVREVVLDLRVFKDLEDFLEHLEAMDPRFVFVCVYIFATYGQDVTIFTLSF